MSSHYADLKSSATKIIYALDLLQVMLSKIILAVFYEK